MIEKTDLELLQDKIYSIFVEFDRICRKHNIKYSMEGGTLMGAVKYQNFVPWDDDIDVIMLRSEYERFLQIAPSELSELFFLQSYNNILQFPLNYAKMCYNDSLIYDYGYSHIKQMNHGIFIDIFPIDNVIPQKWKKQCRVVGLLTAARNTKLKVKHKNVSTTKKIIYKMISLLPMRYLCRKIDRVCKKYNSKETGFRYEICNPNYKFTYLQCSLYDDLIELRFRDKTFLAVSRYDEMLRSRFGDNYQNELPPEEKRCPSHKGKIIIEKRKLSTSEGN